MSKSLEKSKYGFVSKANFEILLVYLAFIVSWSSTNLWLKISLKPFFFIRYGDIFHINIGKKNIVFLCDLETMECVGKQDKFAFRENHYKNGNAKFLNWIFGFKNIHDKPGIILSSGKNWQEQRRFALRNLKDLGLGKDSYRLGRNTPHRSLKIWNQ